MLTPYLRRRIPDEEERSPRHAVRSESIMTIRTLLTEAFGLDYPIVLAPMGGVPIGAAGGRLAAAVSNAGGLGLVGGGYGDADWLRREAGTGPGGDRPVLGCRSAHLASHS